MSVLSSISLFWISFTPLWLSILFIDAKSIIVGSPNIITEKYSILAILIAFVITFVILIFTVNPKDRDGAQGYKIISCTEEKAISAEYLLSYILPLFAFDFTQWDQVVLFLIFFIFLGFLFVKHNYFSVNIMMELCKYKFYNCELENEDGIIISKVVITKERLLNHKNEKITLRPINNEYSLDLMDW